MTKKFLLKSIAGLALTMLGLLSCNKEDVTQSLVSDKVKTDPYYIELEADDLGETRLAQVVDAEGRPTSVFLEDKDLRVQLAIRRKGESTVVTQMIRMQRVPNQTKVRYTGYINIPAGTATTVQLSAAVISELSDTSDSPAQTDMRFLTEPTDDYLTTMKTTSLLKKDDNGRLHIPIPYIADWQDATLSKGLGNVPHRIVGAKLRFKPSGTILRFQLSNKLTTPVKVTKLCVKTNVFVDQWRYNLKTGVTTPNKLFHGEPMENVALPLSQEQRYEWTLPAPVTVPAATGTTPGKLNDWYYVWVMGTNNLPTSKKTVVSVASEGNTGYADVFMSEESLKLGTQSVALELRPNDFTADFGACIDQGALQPKPTVEYKSPLSYLKTINKDGKNYVLVAAGGSSERGGPIRFVDPTLIHRDMGGGFNDYYYKYVEAISIFNDGKQGEITNGVSISELQYGEYHIDRKTIEEGKYGMPTAYELGTIFPGVVVGVPGDKDITHNPNLVERTILREQVQFIGEKDIVETYSEYSIPTQSSPVYALRFTNIPGKKTAYRYANEYLGGSNGHVLHITTRIIGNAPTPDNWNDESYWTSNNSNDVTVTFRNLGTRGADDIYYWGVYGYYWSSTPFKGGKKPDETYAYIAYNNNLYIDHIRAIEDYANWSKYPVFLIPRI